MLLTWLFQTHDDCFSRKWEESEHILKDHVALEGVSREEDGEEICLGPNTQDIPVHNVVQAEFCLEVVKYKAINSWKRAGVKHFKTKFLLWLLSCCVSPAPSLGQG